MKLIGGYHTFIVEAQGEHIDASSGPYQYQWYKGGEVITGDTSSNKTISTINISDAANYSVQVWNNYSTLERVASSDGRLNIGASD